MEDKMIDVIKRFIVIRHVRYFYYLYQVNRHYEFYRSLGQLPVNAASDYAVLDAIWRGDR